LTGAGEHGILIGEWGVGLLDMVSRISLGRFRGAPCPVEYVDWGYSVVGQHTAFARPELQFESGYLHSHRYILVGDTNNPIMEHVNAFYIEVAER